MHLFNLDALIRELQPFADDEYRRFNERLTPGIEGRNLGIRMPELRKIAGRLLKSDPQGFLDASLRSDLHEIHLLYAIVLARSKLDTAERIQRLRAFLPSISNWAVCDLLCIELKPAPEQLDAYLTLIDDCAHSDMEFVVRFALVMLMYYYHSDARIEHTLDILSDFRHEGYYARMGAAWALSMLFVRQREKVLRFLRSDMLDPVTHNKAIQKCIESRQVSEEDKRLLRALRRKA